MSTDLETKHATLEKIKGAQISAPITKGDVAPLAAWADRTFAGKCAWVCAACGARGVRWQMEAEPHAQILEATRTKHMERAPGCSNPAVSISFEDVDPAKLLSTPAAAIKAKSSLELSAPEPNRVA